MVENILIHMGQGGQGPFFLFGGGGGGADHFGNGLPMSTTTHCLNVLSKSWPMMCASNGSEDDLFITWFASRSNPRISNSNQRCTTGKQVEEEKIVNWTRSVADQN
jgi:hypothetical protein